MTHPTPIVQIHSVMVQPVITDKRFHDIETTDRLTDMTASKTDHMSTPEMGVGTENIPDHQELGVLTETVVKDLIVLRDPQTIMVKDKDKMNPSEGDLEKELQKEVEVLHSVTTNTTEMAISKEAITIELAH